MERMRNSILKPVPTHLSMPQHHADPFLYIERQSRQLQQDLQNFLDAQSAGLSAGLTASAADDSTSNGSLTPTPTPSQRSDRKGSSLTVPVRQPRERKLGLRGARRGILRSMHKLLTLKEEERRTIDSELSGRREALRKVDNFATKRGGLQDTIDRIQRDDSVARVETLTTESRNLEEEMHVLEMKLMEMRGRHRDMLNEISQIQNSVDSRLSSYKESLMLLDADVQRYLKSPPIMPLALEDSSEPSFFSLNPRRQTLEMAKEHWTGEQVELRKRRRTVNLEIDALKEGGGVWNQAVAAVSEFEKMLAEEMQQSITLSPSEPPGRSRVGKAHGDAILHKVDETITKLQDLLNMAEQKDWKLLICSIGAELEAFRQAKPILLNIIRPGKSKETQEYPQYTSDDNDDVPPAYLTRTNEQYQSPELDAAASPKGPSKPSEPVHSGGARMATSDDNDDEPPEFLTGGTKPRRPLPELGAESSNEPSDPGPLSGSRAARGRLLSGPRDEDDEPDPAWLLP